LATVTVSVVSANQDSRNHCRLGLNSPPAAICEDEAMFSVEHLLSLGIIRFGLQVDISKAKDLFPYLLLMRLQLGISKAGGLCKTQTDRAKHLEKPSKRQPISLDRGLFS